MQDKRRVTEAVQSFRAQIAHASILTMASGGGLLGAGEYVGGGQAGAHHEPQLCVWVHRAVRAHRSLQHLDARLRRLVVAHRPVMPRLHLVLAHLTGRRFRRVA